MDQRLFLRSFRIAFQKTPKDQETETAQVPYFQNGVPHGLPNQEMESGVLQTEAGVFFVMEVLFYWKRRSTLLQSNKTSRHWQIINRLLR
jgi:hypothetical protein